MPVIIIRFHGVLRTLLITVSENGRAHAVSHTNWLVQATPACERSVATPKKSFRATRTCLYKLIFVTRMDFA